MPHVQITVITIPDDYTNPTNSCNQFAIDKAKQLLEAGGLFNVRLDMGIKINRVSDTCDMVSITFKHPISYTEESLEQKALKAILYAGGDALLQACDIQTTVVKE